ncbi:MAG: hypothetical protein AB1757_23685 [Acidobacteriota bacterium]
MTDECISLPDDFPDILRHTNEDTPVPTWEQVTRSVDTRNPEMIAQVSRIVADTDDELTAREKWDGLPNSYQRSVGLLIDKICHEGWLDYVGTINDWPWDGGFFFTPRNQDAQGLINILDAKSTRDDDPYIQCRIGEGLFAYLNFRNHKGWVKGWMETDAGMAALHVGVFENGAAEVHFDVFNPLYINGAPDEDLLEIPLIGSFNTRMFKMHKKWELAKEYGSIARTSANFYHMMRDTVPLSF